MSDVLPNVVAPKILLTVSGQRCSGKGPEQVEAHDRHPAEHRDADAVEGVAESPTARPGVNFIKKFTTVSRDFS
jgi:hypothetical protein